ncbi:hypothetical protein ACLOJK_038327 [Asimina triloba]
MNGANMGMNMPGANMGMNGDNFGGGNVTGNNGAKALFGTGPWTTGLFDCLDDPSNGDLISLTLSISSESCYPLASFANVFGCPFAAIVTVLFPCVTFGQIAEVLDEGRSTCGTSGTIYVCTFCHSSRRYRQKLRMKYELIEALTSDRMAHPYFEWCALCQECRELANRGLHPAFGNC